MGMIGEFNMGFWRVLGQSYITVLSIFRSDFPAPYAFSLAANSLHITRLLNQDYTSSTYWIIRPGMHIINIIAQKGWLRLYPLRRWGPSRGGSCANTRTTTTRASVLQGLVLAAVSAKYHSVERATAKNLILSNSTLNIESIYQYTMQSKAVCSLVWVLKLASLIGWALSIMNGPKSTC